MTLAVPRTLPAIERTVMHAGITLAGPRAKSVRDTPSLPIVQ